jgi:hypothetical protein
VAVNGSHVRHFQAAYVSDKLLAERLRRYPARQPRVPVRPMSEFVAMHSLASQYEPSGSIGRPIDDIPSFVIDRIRAYVNQYGEAPSSNWVYRVTKAMLPSGGFNRAKARRAISAAMERSSIL